MDPRRALGSLHFILRCYTDLADLEILNSVDDHRVLPRCPLVSPCEAPLAYVRNHAANNDLRCYSYCPYCHQGV